jgi:hypothetical protein
MKSTWITKLAERRFLNEIENMISNFSAARNMTTWIRRGNLVHAYASMAEFGYAQKKPSIGFFQSKLNDPEKGVTKTLNLAFSGM